MRLGLAVKPTSRLPFAHPDAVHGAHFGAHGYHEQAIAAARSQSAFVQLARQRAHEARETEERIRTYTRTHITANRALNYKICGSMIRSRMQKRISEGVTEMSRRRRRYR